MSIKLSAWGNANFSLRSAFDRADNTRPTNPHQSFTVDGDRMQGILMIGSTHKRAAAILFILVLCMASAIAQSGRRGTGGSTTTTATPSVSGPKATEKKSDPAPKLQLLVGIDGREVFTNIPNYVFDTVVENCVRRLGEAEIVFATSAGNSMNRAEARKAAKQETKRWVISLEVRSVYADAGKQVRNNQDELYVEFTVIEPETGNIKRSGRTNQLIYQNGRGGVTSPTRNGAIYSEYSIKQAAREAADRILAGFDIKVRESPY